MQIKIEKLSDDQLFRKEWVFEFEVVRYGNNPAGLTFAAYCEQTKESRRKKIWTTTRSWDKGAPGYGRIERDITIPVDILTPEIIKEAINKLFESCTLNLHKNYNYKPETQKYHAYPLDTHRYLI